MTPQEHEFLAGVRDKFPLLREGNFRLTSPVDGGYNCIAWAAADVERWWWPDAMHQAYWPSNAPRAVTLDAFVAAFGTLGYLDQADSSLAAARQKVAIFTDPGGVPTHAARQVADGWWASKLGGRDDIEHELAAIEGPLYGGVAVILSRPTFRG
ncbi:MAG: hypothetical protein IPM64_16340 [Phycisphaerales bacterium]|nr:hypothetical protein [Phycisphaerales bacterium]